MNEKAEKRDLSENQISISPAEMPDIEGILSVQAENLLTNLKETGLSEAEAAERGFLISALTEEELKKIISEQDNHLLLVARGENGIEAYILGYDLDEWKREDPAWEASVVLKGKSLPTEKSLYLRHVAVKQEARGIGSVLEYKLFKEAKSKGYKNLLGEILREPVKNKKSMAFHRALGFKVIGEIPEEGMVWDLVLKNLEEGK